MLIWDPDMITSSSDLFESREQPTKVSIVQMHSKGQPGSKNTDTTQAPQSKLNLNRSKIPFSLSQNPIIIHTKEFPKLDYNVVKDLKKLKANISVVEICRIP